MQYKATSLSQSTRDEAGGTRFVFIGGRACLDFVNTGGKTADRATWERLHQPADLADWLATSPLALPTVSVTPAELEAAHALREALWHSTCAIRQGRTPHAADATIINHAAAVPDVPPQLDGESGKRVWRVPITATAALSLIARDAIDLFSSEFLSRIRECENPRCTLIFVDTSRPGKRRWCAMERCGNLVKTARYRKRQT